MKNDNIKKNRLVHAFKKAAKKITSPKVVLPLILAFGIAASGSTKAEAANKMKVAKFDTGKSFSQVVHKKAKANRAHAEKNGGYIITIGQSISK